MAQGNGSFSAPAIYTLTSNGSVHALEIKDINNDGNQDVICICNNSSAYYVLSGSGTGSFNTVTTVTLNTVPVALTSGDFNNDGKQDLAIANATSNEVAIFMNAGSSTFTASSSYSLNASPQLLVTEDFNSDGTRDLLVTSQNSSQILKNGGSGTFTLSTGPIFSADNLILADFNTDGKIDLIYTNVMNSKVTALSGNGNFAFNPVFTATSSGMTKALVWDDLNSDSKKDLVIVSSYSTISIFPGTNSGTFSGTPLTYSVYTPGQFGNMIDLVILDINNDSKKDIISLANNFNTPASGFDVFLNCNTVDLTNLGTDSNKFSLYPNPASDYVELSLSDNILNKDFETLKIYNGLGAVLREEKIDFGSGIIKIATDAFESGIYTVTLTNLNNESVVKKLVISK